VLDGNVAISVNPEVGDCTLRSTTNCFSLGELSVHARLTAFDKTDVVCRFEGAVNAAHTSTAVNSITMPSSISLGLDNTLKGTLAPNLLVVVRLRGAQDNLSPPSSDDMRWHN
jgi:hypothetical protein